MEEIMYHLECVFSKYMYTGINSLLSAAGFRPLYMIIIHDDTMMIFMMAKHDEHIRTWFKMNVDDAYVSLCHKIHSRFHDYTLSLNW